MRLVQNVFLYWVVVTMFLLLWGCHFSNYLEQPTPVITSVPCIDCVKLEANIIEQSFRLSEPITVTMQILQKTNEPKMYYTAENSPMKTFDIIVVDETGQKVSLTEEGMIAMSASGYRLLTYLVPNNPDQETFNISPWFKLSPTSTYTLTIKKVMWDDTGNTIDLTTQLLTFTLTAD